MIESEAPLALVICVTVLALVGTEITALILQALNAITRPRVRHAVDLGMAGRYLARIYERRAAAYAAVSVLRTLCIVILGTGVLVLISDYIHRAWLVWPLAIGLTIAILVTIALVLPAHIGSKHPVRTLRLSGRMVWMLTRIGSLFVEHSEPDDEEERENLHEDELKVMVERVSESDALDDDERSMLQSVFELSETIVREVMVPRTDMISIAADQPLDKAISLFSRSGYSRIPVIGESSDDLLGVVYLKDAIRRIHRRTDTEGVTVADIMREPQFVPETMLADNLLEFMQANSNHIAFAVDEYGGIAGLVTIEDVLEELVGEMVDEHDRALPEVDEIEPGVYRIPARMPLDELADLYDMEIDDNDVDTAGGLFAKALGRIPISGSHADVSGLEMSAERFEGRRKRLATIIVRRHSREDDTERE
ncbi:hemolysin family protein [Trueperella sp. LYQ143]|uniref:hemolysin family protein n=1 Tax=Trueperella sp. LYQ143 TaxID=3391059 RepID=UPI00398337E0